MSSGERSVAEGTYPAELECDVLLSDGRTARLRPIRPDDGPALRSFGQRLSSETVYFRFFAPRREISDEEITHFVTVDYRERLALRSRRRQRAGCRGSLRPRPDAAH